MPISGVVGAPATLQPSSKCLGEYLDQKYKYVPSAISTEKLVFKTVLWAAKKWAGFWQILENIPT